VIETRLRKIIERNAFLDFLELHFLGPETRMEGFNPNLFCGMLENLLLYILSLPMNTIHSMIFCRIEPQEEGVQVTVDAVGFEVTNSMSEALQLPDFTYTDLVKYPQMINFYTAQKRAEQLHTKMKVTVLSPERHRIEILVPITR
jgi:hypothetical protein